MSRYYYNSEGRRTGYSLGGGEYSLLLLAKWFGVLIAVVWPYAIPSNDGLNIALGVMWDVLVVAPVIALVVFLKVRRHRRAVRH